VYQEAGVIQLPSQFNTLVQGLSIASITPQQILAAGEPIFLDIRTSSDINSINTLIQSWARIHAPTYGQPIPGSSRIFTRNNVGTLVTASDLEVRKVMAVSFINSGGGPVTANVFVSDTLGSTDDVYISAGAVIGPGETQSATIPSNLYIDDDLQLNVEIVSGDGTFLNTSALSVLVVQ
jgi:hypothetical protein